MTIFRVIRFPNPMTRQEFKFLVHQNQRVDRFFGYVIFLFPLAAALWFLGAMILDYINDPKSSFMITFALVVALPCIGFAWWGIRKIRRKFKTFILIKFDTTQITAKEMVSLIAEKLNYVRRKEETELVVLHSDSWKTSYNIFMGSSTNELYADLRLNDNDGFFNIGITKVKRQFVNEVKLIAKERQCAVTVDMKAE